MIIGITSEARVNDFAATLIARLASSGHTPAFVVCCRQRTQSGWKNRLKRVVTDSAAAARLQRYRNASPEATRCLKAHAEARQLRGWDWPLAHLCDAHQMELRHGGGMNDRETIDYVRRRDTDLLINAGGGIFRQGLIAAARIGILNAHMGSLPAFRGMNVLEWSLLLDQPAAVTVHLIDRGIDTGDILLSGNIPRETGDSIATLRARALVTSIDLMVKAVEGLASSQLQRSGQRPDGGVQYFAMHPRLKEIVESKLRTNREVTDGST